jgi:hypothetical protein
VTILRNFQAVTLATLILSAVGVVQAQEPPVIPAGHEHLPVSGEPYEGFFQGVKVPGVNDQRFPVFHGTDGGAVRMDGQAIPANELDPVTLAETVPEAFIGMPESEFEASIRAFAKSDGESRRN